MRGFKNKHVLILILVLTLFSCRSKKVFTGTEELPCPDHNEKETKEGSKYRLILLKDGKKVWGTKRKKKNRLFKKKVFK
tara:strand:- start:383 stop:619 length:237 start_codon:yes stop_codon:yes gene_type:complete